MKDGKSNISLACGDHFAPEWIVKNGVKWVLDRPAFEDDDGGIPLDQLADNECLFSPGAIYKREEQQELGK
ncbi:hypothetical protein [Pseudoalteromonas sp. T1lg10]|uniref:hypothetical protein n=1 Tax=Pseudoalteromonas sp. T1lg10 TaxID=2077093 RepID=UPI000CF61E93|nr:hypothetical protein [Pseudoalteromonas sp. T1lg10]